MTFFIPAYGGTGIAGPRLGYVHDPGSRTLRSIEGMAAASFLGETLDPGFEITDAAISPNRDYVLTIDARDGSPHLLGIEGATFFERPIRGFPHPTDHIVLSPSGESALLYSAADTLLQILTGLPDNPAITREIAIAVAGPTAVSDDGGLVLLTLNDAPVFFSADSITALAVPLSGPVAAIGLRPHSHDALIATGNRVTLVRNLDADPSFEILDERDALTVGLAFSHDGHQSFAVYADGEVRTHDLVSGEWSVAVCPCRPSGLQPLNHDSVFRLTEAGQGPLFLFDGANKRIAFVTTGDR